MQYRPGLAALIAAVVLAAPAWGAGGCDRQCLEQVGERYLQAYRQRDPSLAPISPKVRFSENNVEMPFPDGSWATIAMQVGRPMLLSDPRNGQVGIFTSILQNDTPTFVGIRLAVKRGEIVEIEHILSTRRNLSSPPTPIGNIWTFQRDPDFPREVPAGEGASRADLVRQAMGYFDTLQFNNGEIRGARFAPDATRNENGLLFRNIEQGFKSGRYRFNNRVRDRECFLIDEARSVALCRGYIDHKGVLDEYRLTDGTAARSVFREPQTWSFFEAFKVRNGAITAVEATFTGAPYYIRSPFVKKPDPVYDALAGEGSGR